MNNSSADAPAAAIRPETELMLCCARTRMDTERAERIKALLQQDIDWVYLIRTALPNGMLPLLYWNLRTTCPEAISKATLTQLQYHFHANERRNVYLTQELLKLLELLKLNEIPVIPFKGPVLAASVYGNLGFREFGDLDIVVPRQDVLRAKDLLLFRGYRLQIPLTAAEEAASLRSGFEYCLIREEGSVVVDLHWRITPDYFPVPLDFEYLRERLRPVGLVDTVVASLAPEDSLLILCIHGSKHGWTRLSWICDVAELVRAHREIDWRWVMEEAVRLNCMRMLALGLLAAKDLLGATLPIEVIEAAQAYPRALSLAARVRNQLYEPDGPPRFIPGHLLARRVLERPSNRLRYLLHWTTVPNTRDRALLRLPAFLSFLYYLIRPIRLVGEYILGPLWRSTLRRTHALKHAKVGSASGS